MSTLLGSNVYVLEFFYNWKELFMNMDCTPSFHSADQEVYLRKGTNLASQSGPDALPAVSFDQRMAGLLDCSVAG